MGVLLTLNNIETNVQPKSQPSWEESSEDKSFVSDDTLEPWQDEVMEERISGWDMLSFRFLGHQSEKCPIGSWSLEIYRYKDFLVCSYLSQEISQLWEWERLLSQVSKWECSQDQNPEKTPISKAEVEKEKLMRKN